MVTTSSRIEVGQITYTDFPTLDEIRRLRPDAAKRLMFFFRTIGLSTPKQINRAIGRKEDDDGILLLLRKLGIVESVDETTSKETVEETIAAQQEILKDRHKNYCIKVSDICAKAEKVCYQQEQAIKELIDEQDQGTKKEPNDALKNPTQNTEGAKQTAAIGQPKQIIPDTDEDDTIGENAQAKEEAEKIAKECPEKANHSFAIVRENTDYIVTIAKHFPLVNYALIAKYLFNDEVIPATVGMAFRKAGISRPRGGPRNYEDKKATAINEAAFICWADGNNWRGYLDKALSEIGQPLDGPSPEVDKKPPEHKEPQPAIVTPPVTRSDPSPEKGHDQKNGKTPDVPEKSHCYACILVRSTTDGRAPIDRLIASLFRRGEEFEIAVQDITIYD